MAVGTEPLEVLDAPITRVRVDVVDLELLGLLTTRTTATLHEKELLAHDTDELMVDAVLLVLVHVVDQHLVDGLGSPDNFARSKLSVGPQLKALLAYALARSPTMKLTRPQALVQPLSELRCARTNRVIPRPSSNKTGSHNILANACSETFFSATTASSPISSLMSSIMTFTSNGTLDQGLPRALRSFLHASTQTVGTETSEIHAN